MLDESMALKQSNESSTDKEPKKFTNHWKAQPQTEIETRETDNFKLVHLI